MRLRILMFLLAFGIAIGGALAPAGFRIGAPEAATVEAAPAEVQGPSAALANAYGCSVSVPYYADWGSRVVATGVVGCAMPAYGTLTVSFHSTSGLWLGGSSISVYGSDYRALQASYWCYSPYELVRAQVTFRDNYGGSVRSGTTYYHWC